VQTNGHAAPQKVNPPGLAGGAGEGKGDGGLFNASGPDHDRGP